MKKISLVLCIAAVLTLTACEKKETSKVTTQSRPAASSLKPAVVSQPTQSVVSSVPEVTFTEQDYEKLCRSIKLGDRTLEFPCTVKDLSPEFVVDNENQYVQSTGLVHYNIKYNGARAGNIKIRYGEGEDPMDLDALADNELAEITVYLYDVEDNSGLKNAYSVDGVGFNTTENELNARFGKPAKSLDVGRAVEVLYSADGQKGVVFRADKGGTLRRITFTEVWGQNGSAVTSGVDSQ